MTTDILADPLLAETAPVQRTKKKILALLKREWKRDYKVSPEEARDIVTIWNAMASKDRATLCKQFGVRPVKKLHGFLKQMNKPKTQKKKIKWDAAQILDLANKLGTLPQHEQLIQLWQHPNRAGLIVSLELDPKSTSLTQALTSLMQYRNLGELGSLTEI